MRKLLFKNLLLALVLAVIVVPGTGLAAPVMSQGQASLTWDSLTFSAGINWTDPAADPSSHSGSWVTLNGDFTDPGASDTFEGGFVPTTFTANLTSGTNSVTGNASTTVASGVGGTVQSATSNISLNTIGTASVNIAEADLTGQFTVLTTLNFSVTVDYLISQLLASVDGGSAYNDVLVLLSLDDALGNELASDFRFYPMLIDGAGNYTFSEIGTLSLLNLNLSPGDYFFTADASTVANASLASVPEPISLVLLGSGMIGLAILRKRFA